MMSAICSASSLGSKLVTTYSAILGIFRDRSWGMLGSLRRNVCFFPRKGIALAVMILWHQSSPIHNIVLREIKARTKSSGASLAVASLRKSTYKRSPQGMQKKKKKKNNVRHKGTTWRRLTQSQ